MKKKGLPDVFVAKDNLALMWFLIAVGAIAFAWWDKQQTMELHRQKPLILVMDSSETYYLPSALDFQGAKEVHSHITRLSIESMFNANPNGVDNPDRLKRIVSDAVLKKFLASIEREKDMFREQNIHQKVEVGPITILQTQGDYVLCHAEGQLIRNGLLNGKSFVVTFGVVCNLKLILNRDMRNNSRFPLVVVDYDYALNKKAEG